jgi:acetylornithine/succinyldiaminopimelate/putrescine aminotransferase
MYNNEESVFCQADERILEHMKERIDRRRPAFLSPINISLAEPAQVAYVLNEVINAFGRGPRYKTFFCNSHMEAVHGAIKVARHFNKKQDGRYDGSVLFHDPANYYKNYFNPTGGETREAIIPGIELVENFGNAAAVIEQGLFKIVVFSLRSLPGDTYDLVSDYCRSNGIVTILDISRAASFDQESCRQAVLNRFDIVCWGEAMTNHHIPFGAFSTDERIFKVWNNADDCLLHSSTFGGNGMALSYAKRNLFGYFPVFLKQPAYRRLLEAMDCPGRVSTRQSKKYINAYLFEKLSPAELSLRINRAEGSFLYEEVVRGRVSRKLDCVGGSGCNVLGHNRADLISKVLTEHDPEADYFALLNEKLHRATGLEKMFQAVSGASAVEMGIIMALLAMGTRKKILVFKGNFGGKTLVALNATHGNHAYFAPLYSAIELFDPYAADALPQLEQILTSGEVGLVWMEVIQGKSLSAVPPEIISMVSRYREQYGYLLGVDEILNGIFRSGGFTSFDPAILRPDIITFAKGLSGMVVPISVAMLSGQVYERARLHNGAVVHLLENLYRNQLSCQVAAHVLSEITAEQVSENVSEVSRYLQEGISRLVAKTAPLQSVEVHGLHIRYNLNMQAFPFNYFGYEQSLSILTHLFYAKGDFLSLFGRILPPLNLRKEDASAIIAGMEKVCGYHPLYFFWVGIKQNVNARWRLLRNKVFRY